MNNPIFFQFKNQINLLDKLIEAFADRYGNSDFPEVAEDYFHKYKWPDIVITDKTGEMPPLKDEVKKEHDFSIELLGCYRPDKEEVVLFIQKIKETAKAFFKSFFPNEIYNGIEERKYTELLSELVLVHEFVHWLMNRIGFNPVQYEKEDEVYFHEVFAQLFTNYYCSNDAKLYSLFHWLEKQQPPQYIAYKEIIESDNTEMVSGTDKTKAFILLDILRYWNLQSWKCTKLLKESLFKLELKDLNDLIIALKALNEYENFKTRLRKLVVLGVNEKVEIEKHDSLKEFSEKILEKYYGLIKAKKFGL